MDSSNIDRGGESVQTPEIVQDQLKPATPPDTTAAFRTLWEGGYRRLVPIVPPDAELSPHSSLFKRPACRGKAVGELGPHGWRGMNWHTHVTTEVDLERWGPMGAGVGVRTGEGLIGIDADTLAADLADLVLQAALEILGPAPRRIGREPKFLLPYRVSAPTIYQRVEFAGADGMRERVELLGEGRQNVFLGVHPGTGRIYEWPDGMPPLARLTVVTQEQIDAFFARLVEILPEAQRQDPTRATDRSKVDQDTLTGPLDAVRAAVAAIPNETRDREGYVAMGIAIKAALRDHPEEAFDLFWEWSEKWTVGEKRYESAVSDWNGFHPPFQLGADYLYARAARHTGECMAPADRFFEPIEGDDPPPSPGEGEGVVAGSARPPLAFVRLDDWAGAALTDRAKPLVKGLLDQCAMTVLYGESNTGKTFVAMDVAHHVARGAPWGGMKTAQKVVAYVAAEGGQGARKRAAALARQYGPADAFHILPAPVDLLHADGDLRPLIEALRGLGPDLGLVVIDTLSRAMAGGDENSSTDMGKLVRHLDAVRKAVAAHVLVVHHSGKDKAKGARGHSLLRAATDTEIEISPGQIAVTKQRDLDKSWSSAFALDVVHLGRDDEGDPVTSCTVRLVADKAELPAEAPTATERRVLEALAACASETGDPKVGVRQLDLGDFLDSPEFNQEKLRFHLRQLEKKRLVVRPKRGVWQVRDPARLDPHAWFKAEVSEPPTVQTGGAGFIDGVFG